MDEKTALLVIDVQKSFYHAPYWDDREINDFSTTLERLISHARGRNWPIVHILHIQRDGGPFDPSSGHVESMDWVDRQKHDPVFNKKVHNALTDSGLQEWLNENRITRLLISGIRTEQCCETTARVASDLGFNVDFVSDATLTFSMKHPISAKQFSSDDIREKTELVLSGRFARITRAEDYAVVKAD